jgi:ATP-dependent Clp protease, protease subunit
MSELLAETTGQDYERIERDTDRDYIMGPEEAIVYGVIDRVVDPSREEVAAK